MTLKLRGGVYQIDITVAGSPRYRASTGTRDKGIAQAQHAEVERALRLGLPLASGKGPEGVTLGALFDRAVRMHWRGSKGLQTVLQHRTAILACIPATTPVAALSGRLDALVAALHAGNRAPATINRILQTLRKALGLAVEWGYLDRAPKLPRYREPSGRIRVYDAAEEAAILGFFDAQDPAMARLTRILLATGFRLSEVLRRDQIVLGPSSVTVWDTKTGGGRTVPVSPATRALVVDLLDAPSGTAVPELNKDQVEWRWRKMREALKLDDGAVIHALRHTCCTRLIRGGMALPKTMLWMGHRDVHTTMRYTHMAVADLEEGVALVSGDR